VRPNRLPGFMRQEVSVLFELILAKCPAQLPSLKCPCLKNRIVYSKHGGKPSMSKTAQLGFLRANALKCETLPTCSSTCFNFDVTAPCSDPEVGRVRTIREFKSAWLVIPLDVYVMENMGHCASSFDLNQVSSYQVLCQSWCKLRDDEP
jgi:hypothetical protein